MTGQESDARPAGASPGRWLGEIGAQAPCCHLQPVAVAGLQRTIVLALVGEQEIGPIQLRQPGCALAQNLRVKLCSEPGQALLKTKARGADGLGAGMHCGQTQTIGKGDAQTGLMLTNDLRSTQCGHHLAGVNVAPQSSQCGKGGLRTGCPLACCRHLGDASLRE